MKKSIAESNEAQESHILGIDFGVAKLGLAIADNETRMAFAFGTLANDQKIWQKLNKIVADEHVRQIVLGITRHEKDSESAKIKQKFGQMLIDKLKIKVHYQEEMFTTKMAQANLVAKGVKHVGKQDDAEAARIILQSWLDLNS